MRLVVTVARSAVIAMLFVAAAMLGILSGAMFAYVGDLPQISALDGYAPNTITRVVAADGQLVGEFATERRVVVGYDDIAPHLREAVIAAEDAGFDSHFGLSISRILITLLRDLIERRFDDPAGASTLTQQLARNLFPLNSEKTGRLDAAGIERKIKEAILAIQIEKRYTKREILTFYCNQIYWGHGAYGVEAASRLYFNKSAKDLALEEAAMIAGIIQGNVRQSPYVNMEAARRRRNYALQRMAEEGFITVEEAEAAKERPIVVRGQPQPERSSAPFFLEEVRKHLEKQYGAKALYEDGLTVKTTLDLRLQDAANQAVSQGLRRIDKRRGYRRPTRNILAEGHTLDGFRDDRWPRALAAGQIIPAVVSAVGKGAPANGARIRVGPYEGELLPAGFAWTRRGRADALFKTGDLVDVEIRSIDHEKQTIAVVLEQTPLVEGALIAIENRTGQIKAMVGGWDYGRSKFNRAVQAYRQLGSTFKPIVYTAAIDRGLTPASLVVDEPVSYPSADGTVYEPQNYDHTFEGPVTLRRALEQSRNIPAIRTMELVGPATVVRYAKRFGFQQEFPPYLAIALGAGDGSLQEVTSAYTVFPNGGVRLTPFEVLQVRDRQGNLLEENRSEAVDVIRADTAYVLTSMLSGVVERGTGQAASTLNWPLAGKTGTVDDNTDAWFIGFDPDITVGVWTGLDEKKPIGPNETGAVAALPIWMDFMRAYIEGRPDKDMPPAFEAPGNIVTLAVDRSTGSVMPDGSAGTIRESFISGTQPGGITLQP